MDSSTSGNTHRYELAMEIGEEAVRQGKWQQALTCFRTALTGLPNEARVYNGLGDTYVAMAEGNRALAWYKEAARLAPDIPDYTDKVARLQQELDMKAEAARSFLVSGDIFWKRERPDEARERWENALSLAPDVVTTHERLAMYHQWRGDTSSVIRHYIVMADLLRQERRCMMALHTCYMALDMAPTNQEVWKVTEEAWICAATQSQADNIQAGGLINAAAEFAQWQLTAKFRQFTMEGEDSDVVEQYAMLQQAMIHEGRNHAGLAIQYYERAIASGMDSPAAFYALGLLYRLVAQPENARAALTLASRHPFYARAVDLLNR